MTGAGQVGHVGVSLEVGAEGPNLEKNSTVPASSPWDSDHLPELVESRGYFDVNI